MIHVGGEYTAAGGTGRLVGSFGCSGIFKPEQGNNGIKAFMKDVEKRAPKDYMIRVVYKKRKNVRLNFRIDTNGNVI